MTYFVNYVGGGGKKKTNMKITLEPLNSGGSMGDGGHISNTKRLRVKSVITYTHTISL